MNGLRAFPESLETARLHLRRPRRADVRLCDDLIFSSYEARAEPLTREHAAGLAGYFVEHWERFGLGQYLTFHRGEAIGICGVKWAGTSPDFWQPHVWELDLGYSFVPAAWGFGYATESGRATIDVAFACAPADHIRATCAVGNDASASVLKKLGMRETGPIGHLRGFRLDRP